PLRPGRHEHVFEGGGPLALSGGGYDMLRHGSQTLTRAHLRPSEYLLMLLQPLVVRPALLQHPVEVTAELPRGGRCRLGLALGAEKMAVVQAHRTWGPLEGDHHLAENPLELVVAAVAHGAVRRFPARAPRGRDQARVGRELVARSEATDRADVRVEEERGERADARDRLELLRDGILTRGVLDLAIEPLDLLREIIVEVEQSLDLVSKCGGQIDRRQPRAPSLSIL